MDWTIIRALSEVLGAPLPYDTVQQLRSRMADVAPHLAALDDLEPSSIAPSSSQSSASVKSGAMQPLLSDYWFTDVISRASKVMTRCSAQLPKSRNSYLEPQFNPAAAAASSSSASAQGAKQQYA